MVPHHKEANPLDTSFCTMESLLQQVCLDHHSIQRANPVLPLSLLPSNSPFTSSPMMLSDPALHITPSPMDIFSQTHSSVLSHDHHPPVLPMSFPATHPLFYETPALPQEIQPQLCPSPSQSFYPRFPLVDSTSSVAGPLRKKSRKWQSNLPPNIITHGLSSSSTLSNLESPLWMFQPAASPRTSPTLALQPNMSASPSRAIPFLANHSNLMHELQSPITPPCSPHNWMQTESVDRMMSMAPCSDPISLSPPKLETVQCHICNKDFYRQEHLDAHLRHHVLEAANTKRFHCQYCNMSFVRKHDLHRHFKIHQAKPSYFCQRCGKGFTRSDMLKRHENLKEESKKFKCIPLGQS